MDDIRPRDARNIALFGVQGQQRLRSTNTVIIGGGGLGSPLAQHLALLGVGTIAVVDDEDLDDTNRNRFVGARFDDPSPGMMKVKILERLVREIDPSINVRPIDKALLSTETFQAVREADWVLGCFDEDGPRLILNELCIAYDKPYIDLASDIHGPGIYGGRVTVITPETGCLKCLQLLDPDDLRRYLSTDDQIAAVERIYGVNKTHLAGRGPSVSPINGVVAALAATEFMVAVTGLRKPIAQISYRGDQAKVLVSSDKPIAGCPICATRGAGSVAEVERYLFLRHVIDRRAKKTAQG